MDKQYFDAKLVKDILHRTLVLRDHTDKKYVNGYYFVVLSKDNAASSQLGIMDVLNHSRIALLPRIH